MPNWCANRLYFYGEEADIAGIRNLLSGELTSHFLRAEQEGIQLFVAGCAGILRPVEDFTYAPFPALTQAGKGSNSPENIAFSRWLTSLQEEVELSKDNCHLLHRLWLNKRIPSWGAEGGSVMVVEFFDYQCIWCSRLAPELEKVMKANTNVRYYFMEWPVFGSRWPESLLAAKTGLQVWKEKGEEAYLKYHNGIYSSGLNEGKLTQDAIGKYSENMKFSKNTIDEINSTLTDINDIATTIGLTGTPGIVIMPVKGATEDNTTVFAGMTEAENIQQAINKAQGK